MPKNLDKKLAKKSKNAEVDGDDVPTQDMNEHVHKPQEHNEEK